MLGRNVVMANYITKKIFERSVRPAAAGLDHALLIGSAGFVVGAFSVFSLTSVAVIYPFDIFLVVVAAMAIFLRGLRPRHMAWIGVVYVFYAVAVLYFVHGSETISIAKYVGLQAVYLIAVLSFFYLLQLGAVPVAMMFCGLALAFALQAMYFGAPQRNQELGWEGGGSAGVSYLLVAAAAIVGGATRRRGTLRRALALVIYSVLAFSSAMAASYERDRSTAALAFLATIWMGVASSGASELKEQISKRPLLMGLLAASVVTVAVVGQYVAALIGALPDDISRKIIDQWNHRHGYLVAARTDSFTAFLVAWEHPWFGIGTSSRDSEAIKIFVDLAADAPIGSFDQLFDRADGYVPLHGTMGGAWARVGLPGLIIWLSVMALLWQGVLRALVWSSPVAGMVAVAAMFSIYGIIFEPAVDRYLLGLALAGSLHMMVRREPVRTKRVPEVGTASKWYFARAGISARGGKDV